MNYNTFSLKRKAFHFFSSFFFFAWNSCLNLIAEFLRSLFLGGHWPWLKMTSIFLEILSRFEQKSNDLFQTAGKPQTVTEVVKTIWKLISVVLISTHRQLSDPCFVEDWFRPGFLSAFISMTLNSFIGSFSQKIEKTSALLLVDFFFLVGEK